MNISLLPDKKTHLRAIYVQNSKKMSCLKEMEGEVIKMDEGVGEEKALGRGKWNKGTRWKRR